MRLFGPVAEGFKTVDADAGLKDQALKYLQQWLTETQFAAYRPQIEWLIDKKDWAGLLDRFHQIMPFGTGGRRGAVGIGPNRMNLWTLGASVQGHCEYLRERFPGQGALHVVLAYDVRRFEDLRKNYNPALDNPVLGLSSKEFARHAACIYAANGMHAHILPDTSARSARATWLPRNYRSRSASSRRTAGSTSAPRTTRPMITAANFTMSAAGRPFLRTTRSWPTWSSA
jgi:phosphoglucomutase/phosphomannomutase